MSIRNVGRKLALTTAAAVLAGTVAGLSVGTASYAVTNGSQVPSSISPTGAASTSAFSSGQAIDVSIPANADLVPGTKVNIEECADPGGTPANLPTSASECDGNTVQGNTVYVNGDGSVLDVNYHVYALPDAASLGEPPSAQPACDLSNECVLYVGENQGDFSQAHVFSQAFYVGPVAGDTGTPAGDGAVQDITFGAAPSPALDGASYTLSAGGGPSGNAVVLSLDGSSSGCSLSGTKLTITATTGTCVVDANQAGTGTYAPAAQTSESIADGPSTVITTSSLPAATEGQAYGPVTLHASTTGAAPYKWKKIGALPKGMKLSSGGILSGTIKTKHVATGTQHITVEFETHKIHNKHENVPEQTVTKTLPIVVNA
jgi:hypothetical protein